ncbi:site-specific integrase [Trueperella pyogenes]|uniref:tyrosine-type recombinase/integrase n=1 Tax=Trueperella pyogenes TaxID=1661 RepID=UPI002169F857|nr:site-specific integrase [Trueperella pyogenes]UVJ53779.1 site-specific integrase [Trueperella pyogenes]
MAKSRGFGAIRRLPSGKFQAKFIHPHTPYTPDGRRNYITAPTTFTTKTAAATWLSSVKTDVERGIWKSPEQVDRERVEAEQQARRDGFTVGDFIPQFLVTRDWGTETRRKETERLKNYIIPKWGGVPLKQVTANDVDAWINVEFDRGIPGARRKCFELFRSLLREAQRRALVAVVATDAVKLIDPKGDTLQAEQRRQKKREPRALTAQEVTAVVANIAPQYSLLVRLLVATGIRLGEARFARGTDVVKDGAGVVWLQVSGTYSGNGKRAYEKRGGKTKNSIRKIPVVSSLAVELFEQAQAQGEKYLFPAVLDPQLPVNEVSFRAALKVATARAGIEHVAPHDFRHTAASNMVATGFEQAAILSIMGHGSSQILARYTHVFDERKLELMQQLDRSNVPSLDARRAQKQTQQLKENQA